MDNVVLPGTELAPSRLGFGSAALMARLGRRQSVRLLEVANENGITHFDTARSYGYGEAESALREFLAGRRDEVTVTTKLGIAPPQRPRAMGTAKAVGRFAARCAPIVRPLLRRRAQAMVKLGCFDPAEARASLETSLRELGTEVVDILLLHECRPSDLRTEGLLEFLELAVREGKVRYFGVATDPDSTSYALGHTPEFGRLVQVENSVVQPSLERLLLDGSAIITHSAVRVGLPPLLEVMRDEERRQRWSRALLLDCADPQILARLLLAHALRSNDRGVVLFSSTHERRICANAALVGGTEFSTDQIGEFERLSHEAFSGPTSGR